VQAQVNPGGGASGRQDLTRVDEQHVRIDDDLGMELRQLPRGSPVCRRTFAIQKARGGENERAGADRRNPHTTSRRRAQRFHDLVANRHRRLADAWNDDGVCPFELLHIPRDP
jgi:hypothetical protein